MHLFKVLKQQFTRKRKHCGGQLKFQIVKSAWHELTNPRENWSSKMPDEMDSKQYKFRGFSELFRHFMHTCSHSKGNGNIE